MLSSVWCTAEMSRTQPASGLLFDSPQLSHACAPFGPPASLVASVAPLAPHAESLKSMRPSPAEAVEGAVLLAEPAAAVFELFLPALDDDVAAAAYEVAAAGDEDLTRRWQVLPARRCSPCERW